MKVIGFREAHRRRPPESEPEGLVIPISWWQDTVEKLLMCGACKDVWVDIVPVTMPASQIECETCGCKGHVIDSRHR